MTRQKYTICHPAPVSVTHLVPEEVTAKIPNASAIMAYTGQMWTASACQPNVPVKEIALEVHDAATTIASAIRASTSLKHLTGMTNACHSHVTVTKIAQESHNAKTRNASAMMTSTSVVTGAYQQDVPETKLAQETQSAKTTIASALMAFT